MSVQVMAVVHAAEHGFHEHDVVCDILISIEHSPATSNYCCAQLIAVDSFSDVHNLAVNFVLSNDHTNSTIRAPPTYI